MNTAGSAAFISFRSRRNYILQIAKLHYCAVYDKRKRRCQGQRKEQRVSTKNVRFADAIILGAGSSTRMEGPNKLLMQAAGLPLIAWTVRAAAASSYVRRVILVLNLDCVETLVRETWFQEIDVSIVIGGLRRQDSVASGVEASDAEVVLIHDGARPLVTPGLFDRVAIAARAEGAALPAVAVPESMRRVVDGRIVETLDRTELFRSQTPHGIQRRLLLEAYGRYDPRGLEALIDETVLVQKIGVPVSVVPGEVANFKVTVPGDEKLAIALLEARATGTSHMSRRNAVKMLQLGSLLSCYTEVLNGDLAQRLAMLL